jgi:acetyl esterase/lipase
MNAVRLVCLSLLVAVVVSPLSADDAVQITPDVVYGHKHGLALTMDVYQPRENANGAGVLFMVSGGWFSIWAPPEKTMGLFEPLLDEGFTVFAVRHGSSPKFVIPEIVPDVRRSVRFVRMNAKRWKVDPERLGVSGGSAGGHLSLMLGTTGDDGDPEAKDELARTSSRVAGVVAYFPPTDLRGFVDEDSPYRKNFPALRFDPKKAGDYSPLLQVSKDDAPTLLVHGDEDQLVKIEHSEQIHAAFEEIGVESKLIVIEGAAHGFQGEDAKRAADAWVAWFKKYLVDAESEPAAVADGQ